MKYADLFLKTNKEAREYDSINATLLLKGGFVYQTMSGVYTFLPLGLRVLNKIEDIVREEMNRLGSEMLMTALSPEALLQMSGRDTTIDVLFEARGANEASRRRHAGRFILNATHEELATQIALKFNRSYKDLPFAFYQIQTKFRNEERPKSGLMRGREFRMKDMYSFHANEKDFKVFYDKVIDSYTTIYSRLGIGDDTHLVVESGGFMSKHASHQFSTLCATGEDTIFYDKRGDTYYTDDVVPDDVREMGELLQASEVGNIFPLQQRYSEPFGYTFTAEDGSQQPVIMGSYGIGTSRIMGVLVEKYHDEAGIIWPASVAPFQVHMVGLNLEEDSVSRQARAAYQRLEEAGIEVLFDDRMEVGAGEKLAEADLLGMPWRVVVSKKTGAERIEVKSRRAGEAIHMSPAEFVKKIT